MTVREYIKNTWKVFTDPSGFAPYPYVPPCLDDGRFTVLYYWDTFFTNEGLIADGRINDARNNVNDLIFCLNKFGCVPNCVWERGAEYASQPPLLYMMVKSLMKAEPDAEWEKTAIAALEKEYVFWMTERISPCGLNRHGTNMKDRRTLIRDYDNYTRIKLPKNVSDDVKAQTMISLTAEGESGEDHTPRYHRRAAEYAGVDLNSHLYGLESFLEEYFGDKDKEKSQKYGEAKNKRAALMKKFMEDPDGVYHDYRYTDDQRSDVYACACFLPYTVGIASRGIKKLVVKLSTPCGFSSCENLGEDGCQWGYPYVWAPHQYFAYNALTASGENATAKEYALRFMNVVEKTFEKTGCLWERYEADGVAKSVEYRTQKMLGWTAGVYNYLYDIIRR